VRSVRSTFGLSLLLSSAASVAAAGAFTAAGPMTKGRSGHTATLLPSGKVLIAGGSSLASAEIYDPASGTFVATGSMTTARSSHSATLLGNGSVLIAGGVDASGFVALASAEIYDPAMGTFSATGSMTAARHSHTATRLADGTVLVAGGAVSADSFASTHASAETYVASSGAFSATGNMTRSRMSHSATLLGNGKVLVVGGFDWNVSPIGSVSSAELYDPGQRVFASGGTFRGTGAIAHDATLLPDGKVLLTGGYDRAGSITLTSSRAQTYDPASGTFSGSYDPSTGTFKGFVQMAASRTGHTATLLPSGEVLVVGGADRHFAYGQDVYYTPHASSETCDPVAVKCRTSASMAGTRSGHRATLLASGTVLVAGGSVAADAETYDPAKFVRRIGDLGGDGKSDVLWRKTGASVDKGAVFLWTMGGTILAGARYLDPISEDWQVQLTSDFNGDKRADVLWRNFGAGADAGRLYIWMMDGPNVIDGTGYTASQADLGWRVDGVGDLNGDGKDDIVWRQTAAGAVDRGALYLWLMNGTGLSGSRYLDPIGEDWQVQGVGDFNGDGKMDVLWRNQGPGGDIGKLYIWMMDGANVSGGTGYTAAQADLGWRVDSPRRD
jgi:hypothetical protein